MPDPWRQDFLTCVVVLIVLSGSTIGNSVADDEPACWQQLAPIPDQLGFAGSFAGVVNETLIVAGGANFPEKRPWEGGRKVWYDSVFALETPEGTWVPAGRLPQPMGYGVSFTTPDGLILAGGSNEQGHSSQVLKMTRTNGELHFETLPNLPTPSAMMCGVQLHSHLYVMGGAMAPDSTSALQTLWKLDLSDLESGWQTLPPIPGPGRMLATAAATNEAIFLFSGAALRPSKTGEPERIWLKDAYRFTPKDGWKRIADLPRVAVAAPSPAIALAGNRLELLGGDDGTRLSFKPEEHPGFPRTSLIYDSDSDQWSAGPELPFSIVTTSAVRWQGRDIIPGGEVRPGTRSTEVWSRLNQ